MNRSRGLRGLIVGGLLGMLVLAGCGGGDDETTALTKAQFISQGDEICQKANLRKSEELGVALKELGKPGKKFTAATQEELLLDVALPPLAQMTEELAALDAPDEPQAAAVIEAYESTVAELEADPMSGTVGNPFEPADEKAAAYGFKKCNQT